MALAQVPWGSGRGGSVPRTNPRSTRLAECGHQRRFTWRVGRDQAIIRTISRLFMSSVMAMSMVVTTGTAGALAADASGSCAGATVNSPQASWIEDSIDSATDVDWFRFTLSGSGSRTVRIVLGAQAANYRLDVYSACSTLLGSSNRSGVQYEEVILSLPANATYRVRVQAAASAFSTAPYKLKFDPIASGVRVLSAGWFVTGGKLYIPGEVFNNTGSWQTNVRVTARLFDSANNQIGTVTGQAYRRAVPRNGRGAFRLTVSPAPSNFHHATYSVASTASASGGVGNLTATPSTTWYEGSTLHFPGTVTNGNNFRIADTQVVVTNYNSTGSVMNAGSVFAIPSAVDANSTTSWDFVTSRYAGVNRWGFVAQAIRQCDPSYPDFCLPSPPPDLNCADIPYRQFRVRSPDPHNFDGDNDGIGCEGSW